jgi:hypothetical protein
MIVKRKCEGGGNYVVDYRRSRGTLASVILNFVKIKLGLIICKKNSGAKSMAYHLSSQEMICCGGKVHISKIKKDLNVLNICDDSG